MLARMYSFVFFLLALPFFAAASAIPRTDPVNQCNTGSISCCNSVQNSNSTAVTQLAGLLGVSLGSITGLIGLNCSPINILGVGGNSCTAQPVCCTGNTFSGLINLGCTPINLNL